MKKVTYPLTAACFIDYQEAGVGRELTQGEKGLACLAVNLINQAYETGRQGGRLYPADMVDLAELFTKMGNPQRLRNPAHRRFFAALLDWEGAAHRAGMRTEEPSQ